MTFLGALLLVALSVFTYSLYLYYNLLKYWQRLGIACVSPWLALTHTVKLLFGRIQMWTMFCELHDALRGHKFGGTYQMGRPSLILRDPELIRACLINNFSSFHDHLHVKLSESDPLACDLFHLTGRRWHQVRQKVSQAFSGAKLRLLYPTLKGCAEELDAYILKLCSESGRGEVELCVKELMANYTMEVIGASALGVKCNAIRTPDCELRRILELSMRFSFRKFAVWFLECIWPGLPAKLGFRLLNSEVVEYFRSLIKHTEEMKQQDVEPTRKDFLQILMNLRDLEQEGERNTDATAQEDSSHDPEGPVFTENIMVGLISSFLSVGYEAVASVLTFCIYELALHPHVQDKIFEEISIVRKEAGGEIRFDDVRKLHYMEKVIYETLRKYPVVNMLSRNCTVPFQMPDSTLILEPGIPFFVSILSLHHDPNYFPEPQKFDPDRFSEQNWDKITPGTLLPFGEGPRSCIASRLAVMDIKTMLIRMVSNYTIEPCARTRKKIEFDRARFLLTPKADLWLRIQRRK